MSGSDQTHVWTGPTHMVTIVRDADGAMRCYVNGEQITHKDAVFDGSWKPERVRAMYEAWISEGDDTTGSDAP